MVLTSKTDQRALYQCAFIHETDVLSAHPLSVHHIKYLNVNVAHFPCVQIRNKITSPIFPQVKHNIAIVRVGKKYVVRAQKKDKRLS